MYLNFFGTRITITTQNELVKDIMNYVDLSTTHYVTFSNVHVVVTTKNDEKFKAAINDADIAAPDGMPLSWVGKIKGQKIEKCSGPDMMELLIEKGLNEGTKHFFYGSTQETLKKLTKALELRYPDIKIVGSYSPPFRMLTQEEDLAIMANMNDLSPDMIWVGLGAPKQEIWMYDHKNSLNRGVMLGVGAAFDFHANTLKRAPLWMQKSGLEWCYRLMMEPKRLFSRYMVTNSLFLYYMVKYGANVEQ